MARQPSGRQRSNTPRFMNGKAYFNTPRDMVVRTLSYIAYDSGVVAIADFHRCGISRYWDREPKVRDLA
ncbi:hypothetical protein [Sphingopyxis yananensis]|uniref:hypothetical protein n=1 Tax=Sphingopyxis yananensis TaxID=2886687 RepID=UPI001D10CB6E|nr:hypothetical protein [Sphingopyxis yananensis]